MSFALKSEVSANLMCLSIAQTFIDSERKGVDRLGIFFGNSLNVHATLLRVDGTETLVLTIVQEGKVNLAIDVDTLVDENRLNGQTFSSCLVSDKVEADHAFGFLSNDLRGLHDVDSTLHSGG